LHWKSQLLLVQTATALATLVVHECPHVPQLLALLDVSTQLVPHREGVGAKQPDTQP
jgi:hypothetical protein